MIAAVFNQGSTLAVNILVANVLGREIFGKYSIIQSTLLTVANVASFGLGQTTTKFLAEFRSTNRERAGRILGLCILVALLSGAVASLLLAILAPFLAQLTFHDPNLTPGLWIAAGALFCNPLIGCFAGTLAGLENYPAMGRVGIIVGTFYLVVCSCAVVAGGLNSLIVAVVASSVVQVLILRAIVQRAAAEQNIRVTYNGLWQERSIILKFGLPAALPGLTAMPAVWLANVFLLERPDGYHQLALYSAAANFRLIVLYLPTIVNSVFTSLLNNQKGLGEERRFLRLFWANAAILATILIAGAGITALFGPHLLRGFGKDFTEGYPVLLLLMCCTLPEGLLLVPYQVITSQGTMWLSLFVIGLPRDLMLIVLSYFLTSYFGALGLATSHLGSQVLTFLTVSLTAYLVNRRPLTENSQGFFEAKN